MKNKLSGEKVGAFYRRKIKNAFQNFLTRIVQKVLYSLRRRQLPQKSSKDQDID